MNEAKDKIIIEELVRYPSEKEWFDFKENWYEPNAIGEYISAISNAAALAGRKEGYIVWGVKDKGHEIVPTAFDYQTDLKGEPFQHYLAHQLNPSIPFSFSECKIEDKRVVLLRIPAARNVPTSFGKVRYLRIGSSKVNLAMYPEWEAKLWEVLSKGLPSLVNQPSPYQKLTFEGLFMYYGGKGLSLSEATFKDNLRLLTREGEYNLLAALLADNSQIAVRVSVFSGTSKSDPMYMVKEVGNCCILYAIDRVIDFGQSLNIPQADERNRTTTRKEDYLFDQQSYNEAIYNAFIHNNWLSLNAPMITFYSDRIEITSFGELAPGQTLDGFYQGRSIPVNKELSDIFMQLHLSEKTGRGVPTIIRNYSTNAFRFEDNSITVALPLHRIDAVKNPYEPKVGNKVGNKIGIKLNRSQERIVSEIRNNPNATTYQLSVLVGISGKGIEKNLSILKKEKVIERVGSKKTGYWKIAE